MTKAKDSLKMTDKGAEIVTPLRFDWHQYEQVRSALDEAHVEIDAIHHLWPP
jgi:hypothetical protein